MSTPKRKKALPPWVPLLVILVVVLLVVWIYWRAGQEGRRTMSREEEVAKFQKFVNEGGVPIIPRPRLEAMGVKFPPNYDELVAQRAARESGQQPARRGPGGGRGPMR